MQATASWRSSIVPRELEIGIELSTTWTVDEAHQYNPSGKPGHEVLSSPSMIWEMETACADLAKGCLPDSQTTVGFHVDVKHIAPARAGATISTSVRLSKIDGNKLTFAVEAREDGRLIGSGRHRRAVINVDDLG